MCKPAERLLDALALGVQQLTRPLGFHCPRSYRELVDGPRPAASSTRWTSPL
jgi:hypothetical protein